MTPYSQYMNVLLDKINKIYCFSKEYFLIFLGIFLYEKFGSFKKKMYLCNKKRKGIQNWF